MAGTSPAVGSSTICRVIRATTGTPTRSSGPRPRGQTPARHRSLPLVPPSSIDSASFRERSVGYSRLSQPALRDGREEVADFVVDDVLSPWQPRSVMIQGSAEALEAPDS